MTRLRVLFVLSLILGLTAWAVLARSGEVVTIATPDNPVVTLEDPENSEDWLVSKDGASRVLKLAEGKNAFFAIVMMEEAAAVPFHRNESEEYLLIMDGGGTLTMDGKSYTLTEGSVVYIREGAEVAYLNGHRETFAIQVFAGPRGARLYDTWGKLVDAPVRKKDLLEKEGWNVDAIRTAEKAYHAEWDSFTSTLSCPEGQPGEKPRPFYPGRCSKSWEMLGWYPDGDVRCTYRVEAKNARVAADDDFDIWAECDIDGDGRNAVYHANRASKARLVTGSDVY